MPVDLPVDCRPYTKIQCWSIDCQPPASLSPAPAGHPLCGLAVNHPPHTAALAVNRRSTEGVVSWRSTEAAACTQALLTKPRAARALGIPMILVNTRSEADSAGGGLPRMRCTCCTCRCSAMDYTESSARCTLASTAVGWPASAVTPTISRKGRRCRTPFVSDGGLPCWCSATAVLPVLPVPPVLPVLPAASAAGAAGAAA
jgi:hypothetical protein